MPKVLISDKMDPRAAEIFRERGVEVDVITGKTPDELKAMLLDLRKEQFNLRFQRATGQLEAVSRIRAVRRDIARVKTVLGQSAQADKKA